MYDAIVISDLHLGSDVCQAKAIVSFLGQLKDGIIETQELILNGDVFDSWDFRRLKKNHWKVLSIIRSLSDHVKIIWTTGNHDYPEDASTVAHLIGAEIVDDYILESGDKRILIFHGHIFDRFISDHVWITWFVDILYGILHRIDKSHRLSKWAKHTSKTFLRCSAKIEAEARQYAAKKGCQVVICGHTHLEVVSEDGAMAYYNSGSWCELPGVFLTIAGGRVELNHYAYQPEPEPDPDLPPALAEEPEPQFAQNF